MSRPAESVQWIPVTLRVPGDRRRVLVWGKVRPFVGAGLIPDREQFLGVDRHNITDGIWDCERKCEDFFNLRVVTHWAEISGPQPEAGQ